MKNQFSIKPATAIKKIGKPVAKYEVNTLFGFLGLLKDKGDHGSCGWEPAFTGVSNSVFSL